MQLTNNQLYSYHKELESWKGSVLELFNRVKIKEFYRYNAFRIETLERKLNDMQRKYFVIENEETKYEGDKPVMLEGLTLEDYTSELNELMSVLIETNI
jgi:hypothetical protein